MELGSHRIDILDWFLDDRPPCVVVTGGTDYFDKKTHKSYDTVMVIYEYEAKRGTLRAFCQTAAAMAETLAMAYEALGNLPPDLSTHLSATKALPPEDNSASDPYVSSSFFYC